MLHPQMSKGSFVISEQQTPQSAPFIIGHWQVLPSRNLLRGPDGDVQVTLKSMEVLCLLAEAEGAVLGRRQIMATVWGNTVVNEETLTRVISDIRRALGDERSSPRYIETIPKRGYRLIAEVVRDHEGRGSRDDGSDSESVPETATRARPKRLHRYQLFLGAIVAIGSLLLLARVLLFPVDRGIVPKSAALEVRPLTSDPGQDAYPVFSPDGTRIAFSRRVSNTDRYHLFVKQPRQAREIQLTDGPYDDRYSTWSPDGGTLAFVRIERNRRDICTIPSLGGPVQVMKSLEGRIVGLDWSPDGTSLALAHAPLEGVFALFSLDLETGALSRLTQPLSGSWGDIWPRYSLAGDRIAFLRPQPSGRYVVGVLPAEGGRIETIACELTHLRDLDWYPGDRNLLVSGTSGDRFRLWQLDVDSSELNPIVLPVDQVLGLSLCAATGMLAIQVPNEDSDLIRYYLNRGTAEDGTLPGEVCFPSTQWEYLPAIDPDGSRIAFCSERTGDAQIYLADVNGADAVQLTDLSGLEIFHLSWSPAGSRLLVGARNREGASVISLLDPESGQMRALPLSELVDKLAWSADGEWIFFNAHRDGRWHTSMLRPDADAPQLLREEFSLIIHQDRRDESLYFLEPIRSGLRRLDPDGSEHLVSEYPPTSKIRGTASRGDKIFYIADVDKRSTLFVHDLATGLHETLGTFAERCSGPLVLYPDGASLLTTATTLVTSDLALVPLIP